MERPELEDFRDRFDGKYEYHQALNQYIDYLEDKSKAQDRTIKILELSNKMLKKNKDVILDND